MYSIDQVNLIIAELNVEWNSIYYEIMSQLHSLPVRRSLRITYHCTQNDVLYTHYTLVL